MNTPNDFDKKFKRADRIFNLTFAAALIAIIALFAACIYLFSKTIDTVKASGVTPASAAKSLGNILGQVKKGINEGSK